jgi:hypothetical protein
MCLQRIVGVLCIALLPTLALGQTLADRVPADAIVYVGWRGTNDLGPNYAASHLKAVFDASQWPQLIHDALPLLGKRLGDENAVAGQVYDKLANIIGPLSSHPTALYFGGMDLADPTHPIPHLALLCDAGADADGMINRLNPLLALIPSDSPVHLRCKKYGGLVIVTSYNFLEKPDVALSASPEFQAAMKQVAGDSIVTCYFDGEKSLKLVDEIIAQTKDAKVIETWPKIRDAIGLAGLRRVIGNEGIEGRDWVSRMYMDAPLPRNGLMAMIDQKPLSKEFIAAIPATVSMAAAGQFDFARLLSEIRGGIRKVNESAADDFEKGLDNVNHIIDVDIENDLLASLGQEWAFYSDPTIGGSGGMGAVILNHPRDAAKLEASVGKLEQFANDTVRNLLRDKAPYMTVEFRQSEINGLHVHYAALPLITPAWTIKEGTLYFALYPQMVVSAATRLTSGKSIAENPGFVDVMKRIGEPAGGSVTGFSYVDLPKLAPDGYPTVVMISRLFIGAGDLFGLQSPPMVVPQLEKITPELTPVGSITWADDAGWHAKAITNFPGDALLSNGGGQGGVFFQAIGAIVPLLTQPNAFR